MLQGSQQTIDRARRLRSEMSLPEVLLWRVLSSRPHGLKFRRQHPSGTYVADFYCHEARLIVEIDGSSHDVAGRPACDALRDRWFAERDLTVLRIPAAALLRDVDDAADTIVRAALPLRQAAARRGPPRHPMHGEELLEAS